MISMPRRLGIAALAATTCVVVAQVSAMASASATSTTPASSSLGSAPAIGTPKQVSSGQAKLVGATDANQHLRLVIGLKTRDQAAQDAFVASLKDKKSPNFRHFVTAAQWNARFGPSAASEQSVVDWARSQHLTVTKRYANRLLVDVDGTVANIQKALGVKIGNYRLGSTSFYSNDRSASLPSKIAGAVQSVSGLNSLQTLKPANAQFDRSYPAYSAGAAESKGATAGANGSRTLLAKAMKASKAKLAQPHITNGFYDPTDIYSDQAYGVDALNGQGHCCNPTHAANGTPPATSIAIATAGAQNGSDISAFQAQYPYLAYHYYTVNIDGTPTCCDGEGTMDLEWATAMANSFGSFTDTAPVYMYDGVNAQFGTFTDIWNTMLSNGYARTMSSSWGCAEAYCYDAGTMNTDHGIFNSMLAQGWTLIGISHDHGAYADCSHVSVSYPGSDPDLLSAGGTDLQAAGGFSSETAWTGTSSTNCSNNGGGGGGGCSSQWSLPSYQSGRINGSCSTRSEPDISLNAGIGQNYYYNGALRGGGGTSIVAPELAGIWAQINAYLGSFPSAACSGGCTTVGQAGPDVYNAAVGGRHNPYYDITSGCTTNNAGFGWCAGTGYDLATGLGSANMLQLASQVLWFNVIELTAPTITMSGPSTSGWVNAGTISWSIADTGSGAPTGVEGYTAKWDSDPGDPTTEPHGGSGNYFWDGPASKNSTSGSTGLLVGCHTLYVRAWDNIGDSAVNSYGPVCYDNTSPTVTAPTVSFASAQTVDPTSRAAQVNVNWTGSDDLSGINNYLLWQSTDGAAYVHLTPDTAVNHAKVALAPGHTYTFAVGAYRQRRQLRRLRVQQDPQAERVPGSIHRDRLLGRVAVRRTVDRARWPHRIRDPSNAPPRSPSRQRGDVGRLQGQQPRFR